MKNKIIYWLIIVGLALWVILIIVSLFNAVNKAEARMVETIQAQQIKPRPEISNAVDTIITQPQSSGSKSGTIIKVKQTYNILKLGDTGEYVKIFQRIVGAKVDGIYGLKTLESWLSYEKTLK